jgi:hemolysin III
MMRGILIAQWSLVLAGIFLSFLSNAPRVLSTAIYLLMGWVVIIPFKSLIEAMPLSIIILLVSGGISYTIGAIIYALKKPNPFPPYMGFHEVFHIFVIMGAGFHLAMIIAGVGIYA